MNTEKLIDLHSHSYCSDGTFSPEGLVILAKKQGLSALALTDHDTLDGLTPFHEAGKKYGLETISGIEFGVLSPLSPFTEIHILGLAMDETNWNLTNSLSFLQNARKERNETMRQKLCTLGLPMTMEELDQNTGGEILTRAHFANVMLKKGYIKTRNEAFSKYISSGLPGYIEREFLTPQQCIQLVNDAGGAAVLAHPSLYQMGMEKIEELCCTLKNWGLRGIEVRHSAFTKGEEMQLEKIASRLSLCFCGGSDFHGENKPQIRLGVGKGNLAIPYSYLTNLRKHCSSNQ